MKFDGRWMSLVPFGAVGQSARLQSSWRGAVGGQRRGPHQVAQWHPPVGTTQKQVARPLPWENPVADEEKENVTSVGISDP